MVELLHLFAENGLTIIPVLLGYLLLADTLIESRNG